MKCWRDEVAAEPQRLGTGQGVAHDGLRRRAPKRLSPAGDHPDGREHHEVIPNHSPIKSGALKSILRNVSAHHRMTAPEVMERLDL
jgi:hypothetical protein